MCDRSKTAKTDEKYRGALLRGTKDSQSGIFETPKGAVNPQT